MKLWEKWSRRRRVGTTAQGPRFPHTTATATKNKNLEITKLPNRRRRGHKRTLSAIHHHHHLRSALARVESTELRQRGTTADNFHRWECDPKRKKEQRVKNRASNEGSNNIEAAKEPHVRRNNSRFQMSIRACRCCCCSSSSFSSSHFLGKMNCGQVRAPHPTEQKPNAKGEANTSAGYSRLRKLRNHPLWDSNGRISIPRFYTTITCLAGCEGK